MLALFYFIVCVVSWGVFVVVVAVFCVFFFFYEKPEVARFPIIVELPAARWC